jgi:hypothetical protein
MEWKKRLRETDVLGYLSVQFETRKQDIYQENGDIEMIFW